MYNDPNNPEGNESVTPNTEDSTRDTDSNKEGKETKEANSISQQPKLIFNKASFVPAGADTAIDLNDKQFWEKVLGPKKGERLLKQTNVCCFDFPPIG